MKKTYAAVIITVLTVCLIGAIYLGSSLYKKYNHDGNNAVQSKNTDSNSNSTMQSSTDITFGEYICKVLEDESVTVKYIKSGQTIRLFSISPLSGSESYDIMPNGSMAAFLAKDGNIWVISSNGSKKKLTPDKYGTIDKNEIKKSVPGYIWAEKPTFTSDGNVIFLSNLPDPSGSKKTVWKINLKSSVMKPVFTSFTDNDIILGCREDGKYMILDGENITAVDADGKYENIDVRGRHIMSLSPNGKKVIYALKDESSGADYRRIYVMDCYGKNAVRIPDIEGFIPTGTGAWNDDSTKYAYTVKQKSGEMSKIAVALFEEDSIGTDIHGPEEGMELPEGCRLRWTDDSTVSIDVGDDILSVDISQ